MFNASVEFEGEDDLRKRAGRDPRAVMGRVRVWLAVLVLSTTACVHTITVDDPLLLAPDEGILLVEVDASYPIRWVTISGWDRVRDLPLGRSQRLVVMKAGEYRWSSIATSGAKITLEFDDIEMWRFRVEPGRINYPGLLRTGLMTLSRSRRSRMASLETDSVNQSAFARRKLQESFPNLLERYGMIYTGTARDDFLQRYDEARRALAEPSDEPSE